MNRKSSKYPPLISTLHGVWDLKALLLTLQSWRPQSRGGVNLLGHLDYNVEANSQRGETMTMMTMTKMINNNNELCIILGVLHLFHHFRTTLKKESNTMMTIRQVPPDSERASGLTIDHHDHDHDDHWLWWQWPWPRWPWVHLLLTFLFCLRTLICRGI